MKMKKLLNLFFRFYEKKTYKLLNEKKVKKMFNFLASREETKELGTFFRQCAAGYSNKYLYTQDESLKGSAYAMTLLAEKFEEHTPKKKSEEKARQQKFVGSKNRAVKY
jgi:hypothetical protein